MAAIVHHHATLCNEKGPATDDSNMATVEEGAGSVCSATDKEVPGGSGGNGSWQTPERHEQLGLSSESAHWQARKRHVALSIHQGPNSELQILTSGVYVSNCMCMIGASVSDRIPDLHGLHDPG
ncbi:hypothetical protein ABZP36_020910 [Zizania latifolia]